MSALAPERRGLTPLRGYLIAEKPVCIFLAAAFTAEMNGERVYGTGVGPGGKDGDFAAICLRSLTFCGQP
jgi:hypothetical protein